MKSGLIWESLYAACMCAGGWVQIYWNLCKSNYPCCSCWKRQQQFSRELFSSHCVPVASSAMTVEGSLRWKSGNLIINKWIWLIIFSPTHSHFISDRSFIIDWRMEIVIQWITSQYWAVSRFNMCNICWPNRTKF